MDAMSSPDIGDVFRLILRARASDTVDTFSNLDDSNERRRKAIESILFSRRFIVTYNFALLGLLACISVWYWGCRIDRSRRSRRRAFSHSPPAKSTTSSLVRKNNNAGETAPLLDQGKSDVDCSGSVPAIARARAWLMYQPSGIPYINKVLPSNATTIGVLLLLGINLFFLLYKAELSVATAFVFADRAGLLFVANLPLLYLLAAKNQPLKLLTNASYEGLNIFHRRLGEWMCLLALLHASSMVLVWYVTLSTRLSLSRFLALPIIWLGLLAFISYETLYLSSLGSFRRRYYELFLGLHIILQAAALAFLWFHHHNSQPYVLAALGIFACDRFVFRLMLKSRTLKADLSVLQDGETVMLSSNWQLLGTPWWRSWGIKNGWKPAEHVFLTVPALSHKHFVQAHPFTIASAAPTATDSHAWLNFLIRAQDGFSRDLLQHAKFHSSVNIRIDGPYGSSHALDMLRDHDVAVIVAGGSGIAVAFPLVWSLLAASSPDLEPESNRQIKPRVCLIWVVHDQKHIDWIPQDRVDELRELGCKVVIPPPTRKAGRPDLPQLLETAAHAWNDEIENPTVGVVVVGPDTMIRECRNKCASLVSQGVKLEVSVEKFGW